MDLRAFSITSVGLSLKLESSCIVSGVYDPRLGEAVYGSREVCALWDTGATCTVISDRLALVLGLPLMGYELLSTASDRISAGVYAVNLVLPGGISFSRRRVYGAALPSSEMLIGMDIITLGDLAVNQSDSNTRFTFQIPSTHNTDYDIEVRDYLAELSSIDDLDE
jgi:hypothetical protein